jgi:hypothetical protein
MVSMCVSPGRVAVESSTPKANASLLCSAHRARQATGSKGSRRRQWQRTPGASVEPSQIQDDARSTNKWLVSQKCQARKCLKRC